MGNNYDRLHFYVLLGLCTFIWFGSVACIPCIKTSSKKEKVPIVQKCREFPFNSIKGLEGIYHPIQASIKKSETHIFPVEFDQAKTKRNNLRHVQPNKAFQSSLLSNQDTGGIIKCDTSKAALGKILDVIRRDTSKAGSDKILDVSNYYINLCFKN